MTDRSIAGLRGRLDTSTDVLQQLAVAVPGLPEVLLDLVTVVAEEAVRTPRFAQNLDAVLRGGDRAQPAAPPRAVARRGKRAPGKIDPFEVYRGVGEVGLRAELATLSVDELKDIIAEHAMDYDKLAMRWKTPTRLHDRIVERVVARETKGDAFR